MNWLLKMSRSRYTLLIHSDVILLHEDWLDLCAAEMPGNVAPAKRVGLFLFRGTAKSFTPDTWALFNAVVDWSVDQDTLLQAKLRAKQTPANHPQTK